MNEFYTIIIWQEPSSVEPIIANISDRGTAIAHYYKMKSTYARVVVNVTYSNGLIQPLDW